MTRYRTFHVFPCSCEQLFDLVADIERYPEFIPGCWAARITHREAGTLTVHQRLGLGALSLEFSSQAKLERPRNIHICATDGPFEHLSIDWSFRPEPDGNTSADIAVCFQGRNALWGRLLEIPLKAAVQQLTPIFEQRIRVLYHHATD